MFASKFHTRLNHRRSHNRLGIRRRLLLTPLEERAVPAVMMVTNTADSGAGSLRQAVIDANTAPGADTISFSSFFDSLRIITLTSELAVSDTLSVVGPGSSLLTLSGNELAGIFHVTGFETGFDVAGVTLSDGLSSRGGAIQAVCQHLTLTGCVLTGNIANQPGISYGGAVFYFAPGLSSNPYFIATDCSFTNNQATNSQNVGTGGAIELQGIRGQGLLTRCSFIGNHSLNGPIETQYSLTLESCTVAGNVGGGVHTQNTNAGTFDLTIRNSTLVGNSTLNLVYSGGAVWCNSGGPSLWNCLVQNSTIVGNTAGASGGGVYMSGSASSKLTLQSSVVSKNVSPIGPDISTPGPVSAANSSIFNSSGISTFIDMGGNRPFGEDPLLGPLQANGGPTLTCAIMAGSPLIDHGSNPASLATDQRGLPRVSNGQSDIGAYETQTLLPTVNSLQVNDGSAQRSMVTKLTVTFSESVSFPSGIAAAFQLNRTGPGGLTGLVNLNPIQSGNVVTIMFAAGGTVGVDPAGSLIDGRYTLTLFSSKIQGALGFLDGNGDGVAGDDYTSPTTPGDPNRIYRLYGDSDGNGVVDGTDFNAFRNAFNTNSATFDFDGNGITDGLDFGRFRMRFGMVI